MADHNGKPPWNLYADGHKGTNPRYREGYDRIFGKKPLPHGKRNEGCDLGFSAVEEASYDIDEGDLMEKLIDELESLGKDLENLAGRH